ncbi:MAG TPA: hypothetical protein VGG33_12165, partial [Polyangia bacterium]
MKHDRSSYAIGARGVRMLGLVGMLAGACTGGAIGDGSTVDPGFEPGAGGSAGGAGGRPGGGGPGVPTGTGGSTSTGGSGPATGAGGSGGGPSAANCTTTTPSPGDSPLRLLTQEQYLNTVQDLFGTVNLESVYPRSNNASTFGLA